MNYKIIESYGYKVSTKPEFAGVDKEGIFFPARDDKDPEAVGRVLAIRPPDEEELRKLYLLWKVEYWLEDRPQPINLKRVQKVDSSAAASFNIYLGLDVTCDLTIIKAGSGIDTSNPPPISNSPPPWTNSS